MILTKLEIQNLKHVEIEEEFVPSKEQLQSISSLLEFKWAKAKMVAECVSDLVIVKLSIKGEMVLKSTRSFVPVNFKFDEEDEQTYSLVNDKELLTADIVLFPKDQIDFNDDLFSLIVTSIPLKVVASDEPSSFSKDNWEVISEEEYNKRKSSKIDSRFSVLDDFEIDE